MKKEHQLPILLYTVYTVELLGLAAYFSEPRTHYEGQTLIGPECRVFPLGAWTYFSVSVVAHVDWVKVVLSSLKRHAAPKSAGLPLASCKRVKSMFSHPFSP